MIVDHSFAASSRVSGGGVGDNDDDDATHNEPARAAFACAEDNAASRLPTAAVGAAV
eukprot:CAMPEP_0119558224 /NCGR_PEP_ID=MMETSP1352-20130426/10400_1 /TAXON_ID=265584 /ORGANISM="Stauroneis constricta, Strain CCMP1120" /LENGTH=56 /DNA_ID=CAMNT_0007605515 /DNA_START=67 /DNA_END=234 /DNA_ORIENTATION=+